MNNKSQSRNSISRLMTAALCIGYALLSHTAVNAQIDPGNHNGPVQAAGAEFGGAPAPMPGNDPAPLQTVESEPVRSAHNALLIDTSSRESVMSLYASEYESGSDMPVTWTGSQSACNAGDIPAALRESTLRRINWFRAMAGVPANITFNATYNAHAQKMAMMISANGQLSHNPPSTWACFSNEGQLAARNSNLILGAGGVESVDLYMWDYGSNNAAVGHRRWMLYPQTLEMGMGDVPQGGAYRASNTLWVIDTNTWKPRPNTRDQFVAWPPPGFVPYTTIYPRWSLSYPGADFTRAAVSMSLNGAAMPVRLEAVANGYGENTLVWIPNGLSDGARWPEPDSDQPVRVTVSNVIVNGAARNFEYTVTIIGLPNSLPPTSIASSAGGISEDAAIGTAIGTLTASDPDNSDGHTFELTSGEGSTDNAYFRISGSQLITAQALDFESRSQLRIRIRATDPEGASFSQPIVINVLNVNELPRLASATALVASGEYRYTIVAFDPEDGTASVSVVSAPNSVNVSTQAGATVLSGDSDAITTGPNIVNLRLTDSDGGTSDAQLTLIVAQSTLLLPMIRR